MPKVMNLVHMYYELAALLGTSKMTKCMLVEEEVNGVNKILAKYGIDFNGEIRDAFTGYEGKLLDQVEKHIEALEGESQLKQKDQLEWIQYALIEVKELSLDPHSNNQQPIGPNDQAFVKQMPTSAAQSDSRQGGQPQEEGSMLNYGSLHENQRNLFDKVVEGMKLKYRNSLYEIFTSPGCSEDLNAVLSAKRDENGNVFSILTYCFYEENIIFNNFYELIGLADKYQDAFRKLFEEESTIDGKSYTALSYAREHSSRLGALEKVIEEKMKELGLEVPAYEGQLPVDLGATSAKSSLPTQGGQHQQDRQDRTGGSYSREASISSESSDDEDQLLDSPNDPGYAAYLRERSDNTSKKSPTFLDKLSANKGKIAVGTIGASLLIGGIITALVVAKPIVLAFAIVAAVLGAIMLGGVALAKTTDKGEKMWDQAGKKLSGLLVSDREMRYL